MSKIQSVKVGEAIKDILLNDVNVKSFIDNRLYPVNVNSGEGAQLPYIVYQRQYVTYEGTKDWTLNESCNVSLNIVSNDYDEANNIADAVIDAMLFKKGTYGNLNISNINLTGIDESFSDDCFIETPNFTIVF